ncbi:serine/threonine protein kinase [Nocardioides gansuensis]|uniref:Serine/threonine protein kinase n=1 Tax=Nocardioides gansuensis TaxID=2138300 RepID=A0A2T8F4T0_9ACTN|nr:serine/threonine protein kinase [Nocardioides gansuensis]PVG80679.1 serine/threonine protein kinase [Nocardioides gansuensis]
MRALILGLAGLLTGSTLVLAPTSYDAPAAATQSSDPSPRLRSVMFVGNNWAGTATVVDADTLKVLRRGIDLVPDKAEELAAIHGNPADLALYLAIQQGPGEGHDQYVDDMFTTRDGRHLAVSRPSFADVVWIDIAKASADEPGAIVREQQMDGNRTDHMGLSPDGRRLLVSDSTARQVIEYSMVDETLRDGTRVRMGDRLRTFESGETPHESNYSRDGRKIYHASIGRVYLPGDQGTAVEEPVKGDRWFQVVRTRDFEVARRWDMGKELAEAGYPGVSSAVRPMAVPPGSRDVYFQVSYFHGFVEFDRFAPDVNGAVDYTSGGMPEPRRGAVKRVIPLPDRVPDLPREQYVNDSAHHGLSIDADGTTLCVAGTMDDYAALVDRRTTRRTMFDEQTTGHTYLKPYWTTEGPHDTCWISLSGSDAVAVLDVHARKELAYLEVGDHPQRVRHGVVKEKVVRGW